MTEDINSYPLPTHSIPGLRFSDHLADIVNVQELLESRGIDTRNTRIERYIKYLEHVESANSVSAVKIFKNISDARFEREIDWEMYVLREIHELMWILKGLKAHIPAGIDNKLRMIVSGSDFAAMDTDTVSRNTQFELRIASYFCQMGCEVDLSTDTDVVAVSPEHIFYLECKRIAGSNALEQNLKKAKKQLMARMPSQHGKKAAYGIIAADVTKAAFPHNGLTIGQTSDHARDVVQKKLIEIAKPTITTPILTDCRNVLLCWLQIHIPSLVIHPLTTTTRFSSYGVINPYLGRKSQKALADFQAIAAVGDRPDAREIPSQKLVPRTSIALPAGTTFSLDENLLKVFFEGGNNYGKTADEVIAHLFFDDTDHKFTFFEFELLAAKIPFEKRKKLAENPNTTRAELVIEMYIQKYPYEHH
ncbi:hypothetical protein [Collimonas pratensis]|uniref:Nuclease-related domain protein n=1 Tax=Collimonas pratensis TaxID=279113 RepID=A0ABN4M735_9BURK|nr:hypothetical protein [Collimonas pratensis]AMP13406.1 hypothetical protein CPter291_1129 [Collimonas pratensis]